MGIHLMRRHAITPSVSLSHLVEHPQDGDASEELIPAASSPDVVSEDMA